MTQAQANAAQQNGNYSNNQYYTANESSDSMQSSSKMTENDLLQQLQA